MRYTVRKSVIEVLGVIWLPAVECGQVMTLSGYDVENAKDDEGRLTRDSVERWLCTHAGDFSSILDFHASIEDGEATVEIPWASEEHELRFCDAMYPAED